MAHKIDSIAYTNEVPWHGLGTYVSANESLEQWKEAAGLTWLARETPVLFRDANGEIQTVDDRKVLYRSDNHFTLGIHSNRYQVVQPEHIIQFYADLCEKYGFTMETVGALKEGRIVWALAKTGGDFALADDKVNAYLLLNTSYDGTSGTTARFTSIRVVCNNTLSIAVNDKHRFVTVRHSTSFDADRVKMELGVGDAFEKYRQQATAMANTEVTPEQGVNYFLKVYRNLTVKQVAHMDEKERRPIDRELERLAGILHGAPGADMVSAKNTVWGLLNAVTYDVDHSGRAHSQDGKLSSAWFGAGDTRKQKAMEEALILVE